MRTVQLINAAYLEKFSQAKDAEKAAMMSYYIEKCETLERQIKQLQAIFPGNAVDQTTTSVSIVKPDDFEINSRSMRPADAAKILGVGISTLRRYTKTEIGFPKAVRLSSRVTVFYVSDLLEWVDSRRSKR